MTPPARPAQPARLDLGEFDLGEFDLGEFDLGAAAAAVESGFSLDGPMPPCDVAGRIPRLVSSLARRSGDGALDALLVSNLTNIRYLTGFSGSSASLVVRTDGSSTFVTDGRYAERAAEELHASGVDARIVIVSSAKQQTNTVRLALGRRSPRVGLEAAHLSWSGAKAWEATFAKGGRGAVPTTDVVESLRRRKDLGEMALLARASAIADAALDDVRTLLVEGPTEMEFLRALEASMMSRGADGASFDTIIASGPNASRPHHQTGTRRIVRGDQVICDFGALYRGYHSDMTRTVHVGAPTRQQRRHFRVVQEAQAAGAAVVRPRVATKRVDRACREVIGAAGWGDQFVHGTGHGVGLLIHEAPWLGRTSASKLEPGDVVTVEPGVYLPGAGGVRIEDTLVVTDGAPIVLTRAPKHQVLDC